MRSACWRLIQCRLLLTAPAVTAPGVTAAAVAAVAASASESALDKVRCLLCRAGWQDGTGQELKALNVEVKPQLVASVLHEQQQAGGDADTLFGFFSWAQQQESFVHESAPYEEMLQVLRVARKYEAVDWLLEEVMKYPHNMTFKLVVAFVHTYAEAGQLDKAFSTFTGMCEIHKPSITVCNSVLDVLVKARDWERAHELIYLVFQWGRSPNDDTFKLLMDAFQHHSSNRCQQSSSRVYKLFETITELECFPSFGLNRPLLGFLCLATTAESVFSVCERMTEGPSLGDVVACNSVMNVFCVVGKSEEAYRFFSLVKDRCNPDDATYRILVLGLGRAGKLDTALELFKIMRSTTVVDVKTSNIVIDLLCKGGRVDEAFELVHSMMDTGPHPDTITCNIMLDGLVKVNKHEHALKLFNKMMESVAFKPDAFTYNILIQGLCASGRVDEACSYLAVPLQKGKGISRDSLYHSLLAGLCKAGKYNHAIHLFSKINCPYLVTYNTVLGACVKSGRLGNAWEIYEQMKKKNQPRDIITFNTLIQPLCKGGQVDKALQLLEEMKAARCRPNAITYGHLVDALCKAERVDEAERLLAATGFPPDTIILTALISGYFRVGRVEDASRIFEKMLVQSQDTATVLPNLRTFNVVIDGLCKARRLQEAEGVLGKLKASGVVPDEFTFNTLIDGHFKAGDPKGAEAVFRDMVSSGCSRSSVTFNTLVDGFCKANEVGKAAGALNSARRRSEATVFMFNAVLGKLCKLGRLDEALELFQSMLLKQECAPDAVTFTSLISGLCKKQRVKEALQLLKQMTEDDKMPLNVLPFNMVLNGLCKSGEMEEASKLVGTMREKRVPPDARTFNTLMDGYLKAGKPKEGYRLFDELVERGIGPDIVTYNTVIGCLCSDGRFQQACNEVLPEMRDKGCIPDAITYTLLLRHCCKDEQGARTDEACRLMNEMLAAGHVPNALTCSYFMDFLSQDPAQDTGEWIQRLGTGGEPNARTK